MRGTEAMENEALQELKLRVCTARLDLVTLWLASILLQVVFLYLVTAFVAVEERGMELSVLVFKQTVELFRVSEEKS